MNDLEYHIIPATPGWSVLYFTEDEDEPVLREPVIGWSVSHAVIRDKPYTAAYPILPSGSLCEGWVIEDPFGIVYELEIGSWHSVAEWVKYKRAEHLLATVFPGAGQCPPRCNDTV